MFMCTKLNSFSSWVQGEPLFIVRLEDSWVPDNYLTLQSFRWGWWGRAETTRRREFPTETRSEIRQRPAGVLWAAKPMPYWIHSCWWMSGGIREQVPCLFHFQKMCCHYVVQRCGRRSMRTPALAWEDKEQLNILGVSDGFSSPIVVAQSEETPVVGCT